MLAEPLVFSVITELLTAADCCACETDTSVIFRHTTTTNLNGTDIILATRVAKNQIISN